ncbi:hypothetical protein CL617_04810 [archaeon]|nr:hypothetical protein [archaeon]
MKPTKKIKYEVNSFKNFKESFMEDEDTELEIKRKIPYRRRIDKKFIVKRGIRKRPSTVRKKNLIKRWHISTFVYLQHLLNTLKGDKLN